jgi:hypothetical protein
VVAAEVFPVDLSFYIRVFRSRPARGFFVGYEYFPTRQDSFAFFATSEVVDRRIITERMDFDHRTGCEEDAGTEDEAV